MKIASTVGYSRPLLLAALTLFLGALVQPRSGRTPDPEEQDQPDEAMKYRLIDLRDESGTVRLNGLMRARLQVDRMRAEGGRLDQSVAGINPGSWTWLGPGNVGGRLRAILIHPTTPSKMWVGSVGGGIWQTTNGGGSWTPVDDFMANLSVTTLAMDPTNSNTMYAGTGEGYFNTDAIQGAGIFKSTDGGTTWTQLPSTANSSFFFVNRLAIAPNGGAILAATNSGIFLSTNGGTSWSQPSNTRTLDVDFHPTDSARAIAGRADGRPLYSADGGVSWTLGTSLGSARVEVAYAPSSPNIVYASANTSSGQIWRSADGGVTYSLMNTGTSYLGSQGWYDNALWVSPTDPAFVIVGGIDLYKSTDSGTTLTKISNWSFGGSYGASAHADHHAIVAMPGYDGAANKTVYFANDGGIYKAADVTLAGNNPPSCTAGWTELNNNLGVTQFYGAAGSAATGRVLGGTQDNGTPVFFGGTETWKDMFGGDGGWSAADQVDSNYLYGEYTYLNIHRSSNGGLSSTYVSGMYWNGSGWVWKAAPYKIDDAQAAHANFIAPFILDPNNQERLLAGGWSLWRTNDARAALTTTTGPTWNAIKPPTSLNSPISAIAVAPGNPDIIWVGHNNGDVYRTTNGTSGAPTWTLRDNTSPALPARKVTRITIDPTNSEVVYVTFGGFSPDNIYRTINGGDTWTDRTGSGATGLPDAPIRTLVIHPDNPQFIYAGGESGIFASEDAGATWHLPHDAPANVSVDELLFLNNPARELVAATHGRGLYKHGTAIPGTLVTLAFSTATSTTVEGGSASPSISVTTSDGTPTTAAVTVNWATSGGTATSGVDFTPGGGQVTFPAGAASGSTQSIAVSTLPDSLSEAPESFTVSLSGAAGAGAVLGPGLHSVTITDDDPLPTLSINDVTMEEPYSGSANAQFTVSLSSVSGQPVTVNYASADDTAVAVSTASSYANSSAISINSAATPDKASPYPSTIVVPALPGRVSKVTATLTGFSHAWPQDVDVILVGPQGQKVLLMSDVGGSSPVAGLSLTFDDTALPLTSAALMSGTYRPTDVNDTEGSDTFASPAPAGPYSSFLSVFNGAAPNGNWSLYVMDDVGGLSGSILGWSITITMETGDYMPASRTLTIPAGSISSTLFVMVLPDAVAETDETAFVNLSAPNNAVIADGQGALTITDNVPRTLSISDVTVTEGSTGSTNAVFTIALSSANPSPITVLASTAGGTATSGVDFSPTTNTVLTFDPGTVSRTLTIPVAGDVIDEADETFVVNLTGAVNAIVVDSQAIGTIIDDDTATLAINDVTVTEGNTGSVNANFSITLSTPSASTVQVLVSRASGTAISGVDFQSSGSVVYSFTPGTTSRTVAVPVYGDVIDEADETFSLILSSPVNASIADAQGFGTILDDDTSTIAIDDVTVTEGNVGTVNAVFSVTLSNPSASIVSVTAASAGGTAASGVDFTATGPTVLTFSPGSTVRTFGVPVKGDLVPEGGETFYVNLSGPVNASVLDAQGIGTILDDDAPPAAFSVSDASVSEGYLSGSTMVFTVRLSAPLGAPASVAYATANGTALSGSDYTPTSGTLSFAAGEVVKLVTVPILGDATFEPNETFTVNLSAPSGATIADGTGVGTILNDDLSTISVTNYAISEGTGAGTTNLAFTVVLSATSASTITVDYATANGSAAAGSDYTSTAGTLSFPPGAASLVVSVPVVRDAIVEPDETVLLNLSNATGATIFDSQGVGTIQADDGLLVSIADKTTGEGNAGFTPISFTVSLSSPAPGAVTVDYATADGTATAPGDYTAATGTVSFALGEQTKTVTVQVVGEALQEPYENFFVNLSNPTGGASIGDGQAQGTITNTDGATDRSRLMFHNFVTNRLYRWHMKNGNTLDTFNWVTPWATDPGWTVGAVADFDQDGQLDYLWHNVNDGRLLFWYIDGDNLKGFQFLPYTMGPPWRVAVAFDADNNGTQDLAFYNSTTGVLHVMLHDNAALLGQYDVGTLLPGSGTLRVVAAVDANNDGDDELAVYDSATGQVRAWDLTGATVTGTTFYANTQAVSPVYNLVSTKTDFNSDGLADFLWHNPTPTGIFSVWFMNGTTRTGVGVFQPFTATDPVWKVVGSANIW
ncbi:MAG: hypothetical protein K1Y01_21340 [Vicinamibacteria bacterium]|nr:hypothetical protein [Vicinamibacteria bacterium]